MYPGIVSKVELTPGYGNKVVVRHSRNGHDFFTWYAHLDATYVGVGQSVQVGTWLGELGDTGDSTGEHVHINLQVPGFGLQGYVVDDVVNPDPYVTRIVPGGSAVMGLHASADSGDLQQVEYDEFKAMKPGVIKVMSSHSGASIANLANDNQNAAFVVRAFLDFGGRVVTPDDFFNWTKDDVLRAKNNIPASREVWLELHNEPNLAPEGLFTSWPDGQAFASWLTAVAAKFQALVPGLKLLYPGLSPGGHVPGLRWDHVEFIEASRPGVLAMDGLAVHTYWSESYTMSQALAVVDDYISRFPGMEIWVTEASHNKAGPSPQDKASQYIQFWNELRKRPSVKGVTYFVASASNPAWSWQGGSCEVWIENGASLGMGAIVGGR